jgi:hypothetical protein
MNKNNISNNIIIIGNQRKQVTVPKTGWTSKHSTLWLVSGNLVWNVCLFCNSISFPFQTILASSE